MAVSSSTDFNLSAGDIITEARALIGIHADEEPLAAHELVRGLRHLTMMLKSWQAKGFLSWTQTEGQLSLTQGNLDYTFQSGGDFATVPFEILQIRINRGGNDLLMTAMSRQEYYALPKKDSQGFPTQWYYDRQRSSGTLYVWPAPDATAGTLKFTYRRMVMDFDGAADDMDLPPEWVDTVTHNLAKRFVSVYGVNVTPDIAMVISEADRLYAALTGFDVGEGKNSIVILPDD